ncbi:MAG TPA: sulfite exporter TauE/SafE family protein [Magnetococcales bacterium]|nr:sulfite exporter TauE/SafE family protein [Magnetococcales bacterium]
MVRHFFYGISRLSTYLLLGALSGWLGSMAPAVERSPLLTALPLWVAGIVMIVMGMETWGIRGLQFGMAKGWMARLENKTTAANHWQKPLVLGILTGLLPCGMHWAFQAKAFATGSVWGGLLILLAFGLGTLPAMLGLGWIIVLVGPKVRKVLQQVAAIFVVGMGGMILVKGFQKAGLMELSGHVH